MALLAAIAALAVILLVVFRVAGLSRWPADAIMVPGDAATLQEALDRASPGATIVLEPQETSFVGPATIDVPDITVVFMSRRAILAVEGSEPALTIRADGVTVKNVEIFSQSIGLHVAASRIHLEGLVIRDAPVGIRLLNSRRCDIRDVEIHGGQIGIELVSSGGNSFSNITVSGSDDTGVRILRSWDNLFEGVVVADCPTGVSVEEGSTGNEFSEVAVDLSSAWAIKIQRSNDNILRDSILQDSRVGVVVDGATGNGIYRTDIHHPTVAGVSFRQAVQNRVLESTIEAAEGVAILLSQSAENTLAYNRIVRGEETGIRIDNSDRNLIMGNELIGNAAGIQADRSDGNRVLRNEVTDSGSVGFLLTSGQENRFLDNRIQGGVFGVVLAESDANTLLRNQIEGQREIGLSILNGSQANTVAENQVENSGVAILIAVSARTDILNNHVSKNEIGLLLVHPGFGLRIEGNDFESNRIGLKQDNATTGIKNIVNLLGLDLWQAEGEAEPPIIVGNVFSRNGSLDVSNENSSPLYTAGNWWGDAQGERGADVAAVSDGVSLYEEAWKGRVAIGTDRGIPEVILGRILQSALSDAGFRVIDLVGMGDYVRVRQAVQMRDVDLVWWWVPERILSEDDIAGGDIQIISVPTQRGWVTIASKGLAARLPEMSISALATLVGESGERLRLTIPRSFGEETLAIWAEAYGLQASIGSVTWADALEESEALLKLGAADIAILGNLEETLTSSGFVAMEDDLGVMESTDLAVVLRRELLQRFPEIEIVIANLVPRLMNSVLHDLTSRVRLLQVEPEVVAREFLRREGSLVD